MYLNWLAASHHIINGNITMYAFKQDIRNNMQIFYQESYKEQYQNLISKNKHNTQ